MKRHEAEAPHYVLCVWPHAAPASWYIKHWPPKCKTIIHPITVSSSTSANGLVNVNIFYETLILETRETSNLEPDF